MIEGVLERTAKVYDVARLRDAADWNTYTGPLQSHVGLAYGYVFNYMAYVVIGGVTGVLWRGIWCYEEWKAVRCVVAAERAALGTCRHSGCPRRDYNDFISGGKFIPLTSLSSKAFIKPHVPPCSVLIPCPGLVRRPHSLSRPMFRTRCSFTWYLCGALFNIIMFYYINVHDKTAVKHFLLKRNNHIYTTYITTIF